MVSRDPKGSGGTATAKRHGSSPQRRSLSTMLPVESLSFDPEALDGWVERGLP